MSTIRVAVAQASSVIFNREQTLEKARDLAADAAREGAKLVLFPEAFLSGYPKGLDFGARIGLRTPQGREDFRRYFDSSVDVPGPVVDALGSIAAENSIYLVIGVMERDGGTLYCTVLHFAPDGHYLGKHRKLMPTAAERLVWGFGDGSTLPVYETPLGRLGSVICWENYMPMLRMAMYSKGIQIYCAPTADGRESWIPTMRHVAMEGRCFVLSCNQFNRRNDFPNDYVIDTPGIGSEADAVVCAGGSCIIDPFGNVLAGPHYDGECVLTADLDMDEITRGKFDFDVAGHYARPDVFQLHVDERAKSPVLAI